MSNNNASVSNRTEERRTQLQLKKVIFHIFKSFITCFLHSVFSDIEVIDITQSDDKTKKPDEGVQARPDQQIAADIEKLDKLQRMIEQRKKKLMCLAEEQQRSTASVVIHSDKVNSQPVSYNRSAPSTSKPAASESTSQPSIVTNVANHNNLTPTAKSTPLAKVPPSDILTVTIHDDNTQPLTSASNIILPISNKQKSSEVASDGVITVDDNQVKPVGGDAPTQKTTETEKSTDVQPPQAKTSETVHSAFAINFSQPQKAPQLAPDAKTDKKPVQTVKETRITLVKNSKVQNYASENGSTPPPLLHKTTDVRLPETNFPLPKTSAEGSKSVTEESMKQNTAPKKRVSFPDDSWLIVGEGMSVVTKSLSDSQGNLKSILKKTSLENGALRNEITPERVKKSAAEAPVESSLDRLSHRIGKSATVTQETTEAVITVPGSSSRVATPPRQATPSLNPERENTLQRLRQNSDSDQPVIEVDFMHKRCNLCFIIVKNDRAGMCRHVLTYHYK